MTEQENAVQAVPESMERLSRALHFLHNGTFEAGLVEEAPAGAVALAYVALSSADEVSAFLSAVRSSASPALRASLDALVAEGPCPDGWAVMTALHLDAEDPDDTVGVTLEVIFPRSDLDEVAAILTRVALEAGADGTCGPGCDDPSHRAN